jgi:hypothetical protein
LPQARESAPLVEDLLADGYLQMSGAEIGALIGKKLILRNRVSGQEYAGMLLEGGRRVLSIVDGAASGPALQGLYHGGDPVLMGESGSSIVGDTVITSDGMRTITSKLYRSA